MRARLHEAFELVTAGEGDGPLFVTCEHASPHVPLPWRWHDEDAWMRSTHWAHDIGAADLSRALAGAFSASAVLARFTRLLVDLNRPLGHPELVRTRADGREIAMNRDVDDAERARRIEALYAPYHQAVDLALSGASARVVLAVHSFTPVYEGEQRTLEVGVLFDEEEALACSVRDALAHAGFAVALNEPYSGKQGLAFSAVEHATRHGLRALELEVRQDLCVDDAFRTRLVEALDGLF